MIRSIAGLAVALALALTTVAGAVATAGIQGTQSARAAATVPRLKCMRLDRAKDILRDRGLRVRVRGGGLFGIVVESNWVVTNQSPAAGRSLRRGSRVTIYVDRGC